MKTEWEWNEWMAKENDELSIAKATNWAILCWRKVHLIDFQLNELSVLHGTHNTKCGCMDVGMPSEIQLCNVHHNILYCIVSPHQIALECEEKKNPLLKVELNSLIANTGSVVRYITINSSNFIRSRRSVYLFAIKSIKTWLLQKWFNVIECNDIH